MKSNNQTVIDCIDWGCLPFLSDVARTYAHLKPMKGISESRIGSELFKLSRLNALRWYTPQYLSQSLLFNRPYNGKAAIYLRSIR